MLHQFRGWSLGRSEGSLPPFHILSRQLEKKKRGGREGGSQEKEVSFLLSASSDFTDLTRRKRKREEGGFPKKNSGCEKKGEFLLYGIQAGKNLGRWISGGKMPCFLLRANPHAGLPLSFTKENATTLPLHKIYISHEQKYFFTMGVFCSESSVSCCQKLPDRLTALALFDLDWLRPPAAGRNSDETSILLLSSRHPRKNDTKKKRLSFFPFFRQSEVRVMAEKKGEEE